MDRAYQDDQTRQLALDFGWIPVVPPKRNRLEPWEYDRVLYRRRNEVDLTPFIRWLTIDKKIVKPGDTIRGQAMVEDPAGVARFAVAFQGPMGRRTTMRMSFTPRANNKSLFDGTLTIPKWIEPGRYLPYDMALGNVLGHLKGYFPEYVPATRNLVLEVLPSTDADVMPPTLEEFGIGAPGESTADGVAQSYDISESVMVWAKLWPVLSSR